MLAEDSLLPVMNFDQAKWKQTKDSRESLGEFNRMVAGCPSLRSTLLPIGDGLTIGVKII